MLPYNPLLIFLQRIIFSCILTQNLKTEDKRAIAQNLSEEELAIFDLQKRQAESP
jgi:hypothetical protein